MIAALSRPHPGRCDGSGLDQRFRGREDLDLLSGLSNAPFGVTDVVGEKPIAAACLASTWTIDPAAARKLLVHQRGARAVVRADAYVLQHVGELQEAGLVGDREDKRRLLDRSSPGAVIALVSADTCSASSSPKVEARSAPRPLSPTDLPFTL